jgi:hypothetical protein
VRKIVWTIAGFWLCGLLAAAGAESYPLADGTTVSGDVVSFNDNGIIFRTPDDKYIDRMPWVKFSQDGLKQLAQTPKIKPFVDPFIMPVAPARVSQPAIKVGDVSRLDRSALASLFGGLFSSGIGLLALLLIYGANLYAGYEIALFRRRPVPVVMVVSAVLPFVGPVIFLSLPDLRETAAAEEEQMAIEAVPAAEVEPHRFVVPDAKPEEEIHIVAGSWQAGSSAAAPPSQAEVETEVFQRGQFMFNRRFFETKFAGFFGIVRREADKNKVLQVKTPSGLIVAERITRITANDAHFEVMRGDSRQEVMVPFAEIQEVQLKHKDA